MFKDAIDVDLPEFPRMTYAEAMRRFGSDKPGPARHAGTHRSHRRRQGCRLQGLRRRRQQRRRPRRRHARTGRRQPHPRRDRRIHPSSSASTAPRARLHQGQRRHASRTKKACSRRSSRTSPEARCAPCSSAPAPSPATSSSSAPTRPRSSTTRWALRIKLGHEKGHVTGGLGAPLWVIDFPMFEYDDEDKRWTACHHPFTSPKDEHMDLLVSDPAGVSPRPTTWR